MIGPLKDLLGLGLPGTLRVLRGKGFMLGDITTAQLAEIPCGAQREGEERRVLGSTGVASRTVRCEKDAADAWAWEEVGAAAVLDTYVPKVGDSTITGDVYLDGGLTVVDSLQFVVGASVRLFDGTGGYFVSDVDATKRMFWNLSGLPTLTDVVLAPPATSGTLALADEMSIIQTADYTGGNVNTAQQVFNESTNGAANVAASTAYLMEGVYHIHTTGTTSRIFYVLFGGTATLTSIGYNVMWTQPATEAGGSPLSYYHNAATEVALTGAIATATHHDVVIRGIVRVNAAGTFIPQFRFSAAPGVAPVVLRNSFFRLTPIGSNVVATVGSWS